MDSEARKAIITESGLHARWKKKIAYKIMFETFHTSCSIAVKNKSFQIFGALTKMLCQCKNG